MTRNRNYSIALEYCGHFKARWVVRLCGEWLGSYETRAEAAAYARSRT